jgi:hypothetical protein
MGIWGIYVLLKHILFLQWLYNSCNNAVIFGMVCYSTLVRLWIPHIFPRNMYSCALCLPHTKGDILFYSFPSVRNLVIMKCSCAYLFWVSVLSHLVRSYAPLLILRQCCCNLCAISPKPCEVRERTRSARMNAKRDNKREAREYMDGTGRRNRRDM